jgi:hypothetical protein
MAVSERVVMDASMPQVVAQTVSPGRDTALTG